jgi:FkbM family methyltransferase
VSPALLAGLAQLTRRVHPRGTDRVLRWLAPPGRPPFIRAQLSLRDGLRVELDTSDYLDWSVFFYGTYQPDVAASIRRHLPVGGIAIDVGANNGFMTLLMAAHASAVVAVEPYAPARAKLAHNVALNDFRHVEISDRLLSDHDGTATLYLPDPAAPNQALASVHAQRAHVRSVNVPMERLDTLATRLNLPRVDLIKIDTEGHDAAVLRGARETLSSHRPVVIFEHDTRLWDLAGETLDRCRSYLADLGYVIPRSVGPSTDVVAVSESESGQPDPSAR